jgi:hypothetical protein
MQLVIFPGDPYVFATHDTGQDLTGLYGAGDIPVEGGAAYPRPAAAIIPWTGPVPVDDTGRMLDPRPK